MRQAVHKTLIAAALLAACTEANAQSTATQIEDALQEITVTAERQQSISGLLQAEAAPKSRTTVTSEYLATQTAGQSVIQSLNLVPGVNFTNSDPYGSSGGNLRIRSFDGPRISLMLDGMPLNDTGNYAIYTNQQVDPEVIERATVNLGTTDVDSPTASATGGTINLVTVIPSDKPGMIVQPSFGTNNYWRTFLRGDTGAIGPWGTKSFVSFSRQEYDKYKGPGQLQKTQINGRIYQDLDDGDFMSLGFHWNRNRNPFYRNLSQADIAANGFDFDNDATCTRPTPAAGTVQNEATTATGTTALCTNYYNLRINPSNTGNIRGQSSFGLTDSLRLTIDPSFQYTLANGGGVTILPETDAKLRGSTTAPGVDLNGDGDVRDRIALFTPNNTNTRRYVVSSSLLWTLNEDNLLRFSYVLDYGKHRQTGQYGFFDASGNPENVFAGRDGTPVQSADGTDIRTRDRYSIARLNQFGVSYSLSLLDDRGRLNAGVRAPFFTRMLNQYCFTQISNGTQYCTTQTPVAAATPNNVTFPGSTTLYLAPYTGEKKYEKVLPNIGFSLKPWANEHEFYVSYAKGLSAPRTDNLYNVQILDVQEEETDSFDVGYRYEAATLTASMALWKSDYKNRIVSSFDPDLGYSVDRNVGNVDLWGFDAAVGTHVLKGFSLYGTASYNNSEVQSDFPFNNSVLVPTAGKELVETPNWTFGARAQYAVAGLTLGLQGKYVGERWATDVNDQAAPSYNIFDADARYDFRLFGMDSFVQLNVINLTDKDYLGSIATSRYSADTTQVYGTLGAPLYAIGAPRTVQFTIRTSF
jgi:iron complex outermembrane receptor protein